MFFWPGKKVIVSLSDGTALNAITRLSVNAIRLRNVEYNHHGDVMAVQGRVIIPASAVLTVQVIG